MENYWIPEDNFVTGEPGPRPIDLQPYQIDCLREAFRTDEDGKFVYSTIVWSDIKKSAKSSIAAGIALYMADQNPWGESYLIANDLKQADSRVAKYARRSVSYSPYLKERFRALKNRITGMNNSMIEPIPIDPEGEAGSNAILIQFSELWGAMDDAKSRMWTEMTLSPTLYGKSFRLIESYAGYKDESEILWNLYERGVLNGELIWPDRDYHSNFDGDCPIEAYRNGRLFCLWNTKPRCPWQTAEYYSQEEEELLPNEFKRMHRNQWTQNIDTYVPEEWWDACGTDILPEPLPNQPMVLAMDAGTHSDNFGMVLAGKHPLAYSKDKDVREIWKDHTIPYKIGHWDPEKGQMLDYMGTEEKPGPEMVMQKWIEENNVIQIAYDEYQLYDLATRSKKNGLGWFRRFPQGSGAHSRLVSDSELRDKIRQRRVLHSKNAMLKQHVMNAAAKSDEKEDKKVRIVKRTQSQKVDLVVCLSMASHEIHRLNI